MKKIKLIVFVLLLLSSLKFDAQNNVGIGTYTPHFSSILELKATDKGILIPRLSTGQRMSIVNPENALLVFDTDFNCFYYFTSVNGWLSLCSGNSGTSSSNLLVNSTIEPPGSNCSSGGILLTFGNDLNNNGVLDATEVNPTLTQYVCNGATGQQGPVGATGAQGPQGIQGVAGAQGPIGLTGAQGAQGIQGVAGATGQQGPAGAAGTNGLNTLVLTTSEPSGVNCSTGGVKIEYGLDANNNGVLDAIEVNPTLTQYVCNGATGQQGPVGATGAQGPIGLTGATGPTGATGLQGPAGAAGTNGINTLTLTSIESSGANCATGGVKIEYGLDANNNGILDAIEINSSLTQYVCNGATGLQGPAGAQGPIGLTGPQGAQGIQGIAGAQGPIGLTGPQGAQGPAGAAGTNGLNTLTLTSIESSGANCATGGVKIEYGLDANNNGILDAIEINSSLTQYVCNGATGPQGPAGATGAQGPVGLTGPQGPQGNQGVAGAQGPIGLTGAQGAQGIQGPTGATGPSMFSNMLVYATPGTFSWTVPAGVTKIMVEVWGGGGGGGNSHATTSGWMSGGGAGGYGKDIFVVTSGANYSVVVGAAGTAGGGNGGTSSFGTLISATGGNGGMSIGTWQSPSGGTSSASFNISGGSGSWNAQQTSLGGAGGASFGGSGGSGAANGAAATTGRSPGGGGGSGCGWTGFVGGAAGGAGRVVIWY
jgi:hypothetical protein